MKIKILISINYRAQSPKLIDFMTVTEIPFIYFMYHNFLWDCAHKMSLDQFMSVLWLLSRCRRILVSQF